MHSNQQDGNDKYRPDRRRPSTSMPSALGAANEDVSSRPCRVMAVMVVDRFWGRCLVSRWLPPVRARYHIPDVRYARTPGHERSTGSARWEQYGGRPQARSLPRSMRLTA